MKRYLSKWAVKERVRTGDTAKSHYESERNAEEFVPHMNGLIRYDETTGKYLVRAAELKPARFQATNGRYGANWLTTLAEIAVAVERGR